MAGLKALFLNCTLKASSRPSSTEALIAKVAEQMQGLGVATEVVRVVDYKVAFGSGMDQGHGDDWPRLLAKIRVADIYVLATPVWIGDVSSVAKMCIERLDATTYYTDSRGQHEMYGKVAGALAVGEGDGAQHCVRTILYAMTIAGFAVPPNADCFWTGESGPGGPYLEADGTSSYNVNERARWMAHNLVHLAEILKAHPLPTNLAALQRDAEQVSRPAPSTPSRG